MSAAMLSRTALQNPDDDFVLYGDRPHYTQRTRFYPTNSDITTTTKNLSQHEYRADLYRDVLEDDRNLRSSLRNMSHTLRLISNNIKKNLVEESTAKRLADTQNGTDYQYEVEDDGWMEAQRREDRKWLADSKWMTTSGHHLSYTDNIPAATYLKPTPSLTPTNLFSKTSTGRKQAEGLQRSVNLDMNLAEVPMTRFTNKQLMASEYFPLTMSPSSLDEARIPARRSRSRTRSPQRLTKSAHLRSSSPQKGQLTDNYRKWRRLEKLYLITAEAPSIASAPAAIVSPYHEEMARLRLERLRLEEEHIKELNRLATLERVRGPKPKWYELKDTQFHFEAMKNNELIRTVDRWQDEIRKYERSTSADFTQRRTRTASF